MITIKNGSEYDIIIIDDEDLIDEYGSKASADIDFDVRQIESTHVCDCCGKVLIRISECDQKTNYLRIYETEITNIRGLEFCSSKEEADIQICRKICDLHGLEYALRMGWGLRRN